MSGSPSSRLAFFNRSDFLYPLRLGPVLKRAVWGGRSIERILGKPLPPGDDYAESWEVTDHRLGVNTILYGRFAGEAFHFLVENYPDQLLGADYRLSRFPLLMKILDANHQLSVQVHPDDDLASQMQLSDGGKDEAWVILDSQPDSFIYSGFRFPVTEEIIREAITEGLLETLLFRFHPEPGQSLYLPAGTVHSLGAGVLVAEIQQSSDHTFRLYDWNRRNAQGISRPLHVEEGLKALLYSQGKVQPQDHKKMGVRGSETLVKCDKFVVCRHHFIDPFIIESNQKAQILFVVRGQMDVSGDPARIPLASGHTVVLPACLESTKLIPVGDVPCVVLQFYVP